MKAIQVKKQGGPEVMELVQLPDLEPGSAEAVIKLKSIGVNFIDIYQRSGGYEMPLPFTPGNEGAGEVIAIGPDVTEVKVGDRVVYTGATGSYAEYSILPAWRLVEIPKALDFQRAAAVMLQGMTAHYLVRGAYSLKAGQTCLVHAAAGGMGLLLTQMAKHIGARIIGTVSTQQKAEMAKSVGCDEVILYTEQDFEDEVKRLTDGRGVDVVYDSVGKDTFDKSINCLLPRGYMMLYGQSSGAVPPVDPQLLNRKGSLFLTRPSLAHYTATRDELLQRASDVLEWVASGELRVHINSDLPLAQAPEAHRLLQSRGTMGKVLLRP